MDGEYGDEVTRRLHETDDARVWAREWCRIARDLIGYKGGSEIDEALIEDKLLDEGWMIGWFANAIETGKRIDRERHPERKPAQDVDYVLLPREAFLMFCGQYVLPREGDCAPVASMIVEWLEANDLGDLYRRIGDGESSGG